MALDAGNSRVLDECVQGMLTADPWEWRAVWLAGLGALAAKDYVTAQSSFNAVYGQVPGELAPKLALAVACELGNEPDLAETLYKVCASTDANYVTPAAFGLARVRAAHDDIAGSLAALQLVPSTSRGYPESQRLLATNLVAVASDPDGITKALSALSNARLDPQSEAEQEQVLYELALELSKGRSLKLAGREVPAAQLRDLLEQTYRKRARLCDDPAVRAAFVDLANSIRPWSLL